MSDIVDHRTRSVMMSGIRGKNTKPELALRSELHKRGFRFRVHYKKLPGTPDLVFPKYKAIILINGCFWHGHDCHLFRWPATRAQFWKTKIESNILRDQKNFNKYRELNWKTLVIWECALKGKAAIGINQTCEVASRWLQFDHLDAEITGRPLSQLS